MSKNEKILGAIGVLLVLYLLFRTKVSSAPYAGITTGPTLEQAGSVSGEQVMQDANTPLTSGPSYFGGPVPRSSTLGGLYQTVE
jgi:hypothetical protein